MTAKEGPVTRALALAPNLGPPPERVSAPGGTGAALETTTNKAVSKETPGAAAVFPGRLKKYEFHPLADIFPMIPPAELDGLGADIKANGLLEPITLYEGKILDGRNRYNMVMFWAVDDRGAPIHKPRFVEFDGDDPLAFVISKNLKRRHLNASQRAMTAARLAGLKRGRPSKENSANAPLSNSAAANLLNVSVDNVKRARKVLESGDRKLIHAVDDGAKRVSAAEASLRPKEARKPLKPTAEDLLARVAERARWLKLATARLRDAVVNGDLVLPFEALLPISLDVAEYSSAIRDVADAAKAAAREDDDEGVDAFRGRVLEAAKKKKPTKAAKKKAPLSAKAAASKAAAHARAQEREEKKRARKAKKAAAS